MYTYPYLAKHDRIPKRMGGHTSLVQLVKLCLYSFPKESALEPRSISSRHDGLVYPIKDSWHRREEVWFQKLSIIHKAERIASEVPDTPPNRNNSQLANALSPIVRSHDAA